MVSPSTDGMHIKLSWENNQYKFTPVILLFSNTLFENVFANKNNKTLGQTLLHRRYEAFTEESSLRYPEYLGFSLGKFLLTLKENGDRFYMKFLNKFGDLTYSKFWVDDEQVLKAKGLYLYSARNSLQYIGRCRDSYKKRINLGYGTIHPKNCFIDGQLTNCHINALITQFRMDISLFICNIEDNQAIVKAERGLIEKYKPLWNIQGL